MALIVAIVENLLFKDTVWITNNGTLKPAKNITQLNTKLGFSVTHFILNFIPLSQIQRTLFPEHSLR